MSHEIRNPSRDNERGTSKSKRFHGTSSVSPRASVNDAVTSPKHVSYYMGNVLSSFEAEMFFKNCLAKEGHPIDTPLQAATKASSFARFSCPHKSDKNKHAAYKAFFDGRPTLFFQCHACATEVMKFIFKKEFSADERKDYAKKMEEQRLKNIVAVKKAKEDKARALRAMTEEWRFAKSCVNHPYFKLKQVTVAEADGMRINAKNHLLCPIRSISGEMVSLQRIYWDKVKNKFEKRFFTGLSSTGFHILDELKGCDTIFFCEGIATCLTIREALGLPVICVYGKRFDSIGKVIRDKYPAAKLMFCCDVSINPNEKITSEDNAKKAIALIGVNGSYALPDFAALGITEKEMAASNLTDFNDLFSVLLRSGLEIKAALGQVRHQLTSNV